MKVDHNLKPIYLSGDHQVTSRFQSHINVFGMYGRSSHVAAEEHLTGIDNEKYVLTVDYGV